MSAFWVYSSSTSITSEQTSLIFSVRSVVLSSFSSTFSAYHTGKSSSSISLSAALDVMAESASAFTPLLFCLISFTVTRNPFSMAVLPFFITAAKPGPIGLSGVWSESGIQQIVALAVWPKSCLSLAKCSCVHAVPRAAMVLSMPSDCSFIASGAPSTQYTFPSLSATVRAISSPKISAPLWNMKESLLLRYFIIPGSSTIVLAVKAITRPQRSVTGIMMRSRKKSI